LINAYAAVPIEQRLGLAPLLMLEGAVHQAAGDPRGALENYQMGADIRYANRGGGPSFQRFMDLCFVAGASIASRDSSKALTALREAWVKGCEPFGRSPKHFRFLAPLYCRPRWAVDPLTSASATIDLEELQAALLENAMEPQ